MSGALLLSLAHLAVGAARRCGDEPTPPALMPAGGGAIVELAIQFHRPGHELFLPVFAEVLGALSPGTTVHVVVADAEDERLFEAARRRWFPRGGGPRVRYAHAGRPITSWMRDRLAVLESDPPILLAPDAPMPGDPARVNDWWVPWTLREHLGDATLRRTRYVFEGGDLIGDARSVYVATPLFERNRGVDPEGLAAALSADLGRPVVRLGTTGPVPDHHVGMFLTPLGDGRVAWGDPDAALRALGWSEGEARAPVVGGERFAIDLSPERLERFRRVGRELEAAGVETVALPLLPGAIGRAFLSYDNVLLDRREDGDHVLLPVYGVRTLDEAAISAWRALGYVVHPIDVAMIFRLGGSVRCLVAPLRRAPR